MNSDSEDDHMSQVYLVPTAHVSEKSSNLVRETVECVQPDIVALELDKKRYQRIQTKSDYNISIKDALFLDEFSRISKVLIYLLSKLQQQTSSKVGIGLNGSDMKVGITASEEYEIPVALVDRPVEKTLSKFSDSCNLWEIAKFSGYLILSSLFVSRMSSEDVEEKIESSKSDVKSIIEDMEEIFPSFVESFIIQRDSVISENIQELAKSHDSIVLVVGAAHKRGIITELQSDEDIRVQDVSKIYLEGDTRVESQS